MIAHGPEIVPVPVVRTALRCRHDLVHESAVRVLVEVGLVALAARGEVERMLHGIAARRLDIALFDQHDRGLMEPPSFIRLHGLWVFARGITVLLFDGAPNGLVT